MRSTWGDRDAGRWIDQTTNLFVGTAAEAYLAAGSEHRDRAAGLGVRARRRPPRRAHRGARPTRPRRHPGAGRQRRGLDRRADRGDRHELSRTACSCWWRRSLQPAAARALGQALRTTRRRARPRQSGGDRRRPRHRLGRHRHRAPRPERADRRGAPPAQGSRDRRRQPASSPSICRPTEGISPCRVSRLALLLSAALLPQAAHAGAWLAPEGHGQVVVTGTASSAGKAFDGSGSLQSTPRYNKHELQALMEYGVTDWLTAIAIPTLAACRHRAADRRQPLRLRQQRVRRPRPRHPAGQLGAVGAGHRPRARHRRHQQSRPRSATPAPTSISACSTA